MRNFLQAGETITVPAPAATLSGSGVLIGKLFGVAAGDAVEGAPLDLTTTGVFALPKVAADEFAIGDSVFFISASKLATKTATANALVGTAVKPAAASTGTVEVRLNGFVV